MHLLLMLLWFWLPLPFDNFSFRQNGGPFESMHFLNTVNFCSPLP